MRYVMIAVGGALGSVARYAVGTWVQHRMAGHFQWGTFIVNMTACLIMGLATTIIAERIVVNPGWRYLIPVGFIGAYSTFSAFELDVFRSNADGAWLISAAYVAASVV